MRSSRVPFRRSKLMVLIGAAIAALPAFSQGPPVFRPADLDQLVSRIALYPDPLLAQVLAAATYPEQIPDAARWSNQHHYLTGDGLARAIESDMLPWDPSVQALLPFPQVLDMMARDIGWTQQLGDAFLAQNADVMDAVQRMRREARDYGYLRSNGQIVVSRGPYIEIVPVNPAFIYVPYYDPLVVFAAPRRGFAVGAAIGFGFGVSIGPAFRPWGWGGNRMVWDAHVVIVNDAPWRRNWINRTTYVHPYTVRRGPIGPGPRFEERHELHERTDRERAADRSRNRVEEHRDDNRRNDRRDDRRNDDRRNDDRRDRR